MKRSLTAITLILAGLLAAAAPALAQTRYVSDELVINLRRGKGDEYRILRMVRAGTPLEVLPEDEEDERWIKVRIPSGEEGYVLKQYVTTETPKPIVISRQREEIERLKARLDRQEGNRAGLTGELQAAQDQVKTLEAQLAQTQKELQAAQGRLERLQAETRDVVAVIEERDRLKEENSRIGEDARVLKEENEKLLLTGMIQWFLAGGGVFFFGWIIGKVSRSKRRY